MHREPDFHTTFILRCLHALIGLFLLTLSGAAQSGAIDSVEFDERKVPAQIRVNFTWPLQYVTHAPQTAGDEFHIQLRQPRMGFDTVEQADDPPQHISPPSSGAVPLRNVSYEPDTNDGGTLTLRFARTVSLSVREGADRRHLVISVVTPIADSPAGEYAGPETATTGSNRSADSPSMFVLGGNRYIVNLESSTKPIPVPELTGVEDPEQYLLYTAQFVIDDRVWTRLRVGFFASRKDAQRFVETIKPQYPRAWIAFADHLEVSEAVAKSGRVPVAVETSTAAIPPAAPAPVPAISAVAAGAAPPAATPSAEIETAPPAIEPTRPRTNDERIEALMEEARQAVARNDYHRAIQLYTKILEFPDHRWRQDALEFLGFARERNNQLAHAIREYQRYLALYPDGEGAERVRQRLAGLTTAAQRPTPSSQRPRSKDAAIPWDVYGGISQYYRRDESSLDSTGDIVTQSSLYSDVDVTARKRSNSYDFQSRFTGSYLYDFLSDGSGDQTSVSSLYFDALDKQRGISVRFGRQSRNTGGVLGRFDGLLAGYRLTDWMTVNGVAGYPVLSTRDQVDTDRYLYGLSVDLGTFANAWDFNAFIIEQQAEEVLDRRAIGGEARYFDPVRSFLTFVDYDISYDSLNTLILLGTWTLPDRTTVNATVDYRNSPILTTTNALQGQTVRNIDELLDNLSEQEVRDLAEDRTAESTTVTLGASHPFSERIQLSGDVTIANLSDTDGSGGVEPIPGTGNEYFYGLQLIGSSLIKAGDIGILGLRYSNLSTARIYSASLNSRYPVNQVWRVNPRLRVDYRENDRDDSTQWITVPSLRMDYRFRRRLRFEAEAGGEWSTRQLSVDNEDSSSWFLNVGYRLDF